jgi:hypothetical protein
VLPEGGPAKLNAIDTLMAVMANPASASELASGELLRACQVFWPTDPLAGLQRIYFKGGFDRLDPTDNTKQLEPFAAAFLSCFPINHEYYSARSAVTYWLKLSEICPAATRASFQVHFVRRYVIQDWHRNILDESRHIPFLPEAEARLREALAFQTASRNSADPAEGAAFASEATKRARKSRVQGRGVSRRQRSRGVSAGLVAVIIVGVITAAILVVAVVMTINGGKTKPTEPDQTPVPEHKAEKKPQQKKPQ